MKYFRLILLVHLACCSPALFAEELYPLAPSTSSSKLSTEDPSNPELSTSFTGSTEIHSSFSSASPSPHDPSSLTDFLTPSLSEGMPLSNGLSVSVSKSITPTTMSAPGFNLIKPSSSSPDHLADHFLGEKAPRANVEPFKSALGPYTQERIPQHLSLESPAHQARQAPDVTNILKGLLNVVGEGLSIATNFVKEENKRKKLASSISLAAHSATAIKAGPQTRPTRPPRPSRINNRGPPRLTEIPFESIPLEVLGKPKPGKGPLVQIPQRPFNYRLPPRPPLIGSTNPAPGGVPLPQLLIPQIGNKKTKKKIKTKINLIRPTRIPVNHLQHTYSPTTSLTPKPTTSTTTIVKPKKPTPTTSTASSTTITSTTSKPTTTRKTPPLPPLTFVPALNTTTTTKRPAVIKSKPVSTSGPKRPPLVVVASAPKPHKEEEQEIIRPQIQSANPEPEIINLTLTADQNFGNPFQNGRPDILTYSPGQEEQFVNINGQKTYFDIGPTRIDNQILPSRPSQPVIPTSKPVQNGNIGSAEVVRHEDIVDIRLPPPLPTDHRPLKAGPTRRPNAPPIRIDTCIVGDEATCDKDKHEVCKVFLGVSSCFCKPGYGRRNHRHPCKKTVRLLMSLQVDRINHRQLLWSNQYRNPNSEEYQLLEGESNYAVDTSMALTSFSSSYIGNNVNRFFALNGKVTVNLTLELFQNPYTTSPIIKRDIQRKLIQVIQARDSNIGNGNLYVDGPLNPIPGVADLDECSEPEMNDCNEKAECINKFGTFTCLCQKGYGDPFRDDEDLMGRYCQSCSADNCSGRGVCSLEDGIKVCECKGNYYGKSCEIDGDVLAVAIGASVAAVVIIVLTLFCLCLWSRKWRKEEEKGLAASGIYSTPNYSGVNHQINNSIYQQPSMSHQIVSPYPRRLPPPPPATGPPPPNMVSSDLSERLRWMHEVLNQQNAYAQLQPPQAPPTPSQFTVNGLYSVPVNSSHGYLPEEQIYGTLPRIYNEPRRARRPKLMRRASSDERISELQFRKGFVIQEEEEEESTSFGSSSESVYHVRPRSRPSRPMSHIDARNRSGMFGFMKK